MEIVVDKTPMREGDQCRLQCRRPSYSPYRGLDLATCRGLYLIINGTRVQNLDSYNTEFSSSHCVGSLRFIAKPEHNNVPIQCGFDFVLEDDTILQCTSEPISIILEGL